MARGLYYAAQFLTGPIDAPCAAILCDCLARLDEYAMRANPSLNVDLVTSGLRYGPEARGYSDQYLSAEPLLHAGYGDCTEFSAYRVAQLRIAGRPARVVIVDGGGDLHAIVGREGDRLEDPSLLVGMPSYPWPPKILALGPWAKRS